MYENYGNKNNSWNNPISIAYAYNDRMMDEILIELKNRVKIEAELAKKNIELIINDIETYFENKTKSSVMRKYE